MLTKGSATIESNVTTITNYNTDSKHVQRFV